MNVSKNDRDRFVFKFSKWLKKRYRKFRRQCLLNCRPKYQMDPQYVRQCLTNSYQLSSSAAAKNKDTVIFLGVWEQINNPDFYSPKFEGIRKEAGRNGFYLSAKKWIDVTGAKGLVAAAGRYGGTYAHKDIAFEKRPLAEFRKRESPVGQFTVLYLGD